MEKYYTGKGFLRMITLLSILTSASVSLLFNVATLGFPAFAIPKPYYQHFACVDSSCILVNGPGLDECIGNNECTHPPSPSIGVTLRKQVDNTGGGTALATDWNLELDNEGGSLMFEGKTGTPEVSNILVPPGTYVISETPSNGIIGNNYQLSTSCIYTNNDYETPLSFDVLTIEENDDSVFCTLKNTYKSSKLTLKKIVDNTGGGTALATDWILKAQRNELFGKIIEGAMDSDEVTDVSIVPGEYSLSESGGPEEYTATLWFCTKEGSSIATQGNFITLAIGDKVICTIKNKYNPSPPAILTLKKVVTVAPGQSGPPASLFILRARNSLGEYIISGSTNTFATNNIKVSPGEYLLSEIISGGTPPSAKWTCNNGITLASNNLIILKSGDNIVCTITNKY